MSKRRWLALLACLMIAALALVPWVSRARHHINPETFARITRGMTLEEVQDLLGVPSGDYTTKPSVMIHEDLFGSRITGREVEQKWVSDAGAISIWFDEDGKVVSKEVRRVE